MLSRVWQKIVNFSKKDPVTFVLILCVLLIGGVFANYEVLHMTSEPEFCQMCHPEQKTGPLSEYHTWEQSAHAAAGVKCLDCHGEPGFMGYFRAKMGGLKDLYGEIVFSKEHKLEILEKGATDKEYAKKLVPNTTCLFCHSAQINAETRETKVISIGLEFRKLDTVRNPEFLDSYRRSDVLSGEVATAVNPRHTSHLAQGLDCVDCHMGVAHEGGFHNLPTMQSCFDCHDNKRKENKKIKAPKNGDCVTCHVGQVAAQKGTLAKAEGINSPEWFMASLSCGDCHMDAFERPQAESCGNCHDQSYVELAVDTQKSYTARLEALKAEWLKLTEERGHMKEGQENLLNQLGYFVRVLERDGSKGIHNPDFFFEVFRAAEDLPVAIENYKTPVAKPKGEPGEDIKKHEEAAGAAAPVKAAPAVAAVQNTPEQAAMVEFIPETIDLASSFGIEAKKKPVLFAHAAHAQNNACAECHVETDTFKLKYDIVEKTGTKNDFHAKMCFPCHEEKGVKVGKSCNKCHK